jgi:hypothetical protein
MTSPSTPGSPIAESTTAESTPATGSSGGSCATTTSAAGIRGRGLRVPLLRPQEAALTARENLKLGEGGEEGRDNNIVRETSEQETFERTGASVVGRRVFDAGEQGRPAEAPFHPPVFVVAHEQRDPWQRPGGPPFTSSTTTSRPRSTRPARPPATGTSASRAAAQQPWST